MPTRTAFSKRNPFLQIEWNSSSIGLYMTCPREYYLAKVLGYQSKHKSLPLVFGTAMHTACEVYDRARIAGYDHEYSVRAAVWWGLALFPKSDDNKRSRETLARSIVWYLDENAERPIKTVVLKDYGPAIELPFKIDCEMPGIQDEISIVGTLDKLIEYMDSLWVLDRKHTAQTIGEYYFAQYTPDVQLSTYILAANVCYSTQPQGGIIDVTQIAVGFSRNAIGFVTRTEAQLNEWWETLRVWINKAVDSAELLAAGYGPNSAYPMNTTSCHKFGGCRYRDVCDKDPAVRDAFLNTNFEQINELD